MEVNEYYYLGKMLGEIQQQIDALKERVKELEEKYEKDRH